MTASDNVEVRRELVENWLDNRRNLLFIMSSTKREAEERGETPCLNDVISRIESEIFELEAALDQRKD